MDGAEERRGHIYLGQTGKAESYTHPGSGGGSAPDIPARNRSQHGPMLQSQLQDLKTTQARLAQEAEAQDMESLIGIQVEFESFPELDLAIEQLGDVRQRIELMSVRHTENRTFATVFFPQGKLDVVERRIADYLSEKRDRNGKPRDYRCLIDSIAALRAATLDALWTDPRELLPTDEDEAFWWEVWLPARDDHMAVVNQFRRLAEAAQIRVSEGALEFPERTVLLAKGARRQFAQNGLLLNCMSEVRRAKETAAFFDELNPGEQHEWADDLVTRLQSPSQVTSHVCILDTGINHGHPLIAPFHGAADQFTVDPAWTGADEHGHGTGMAGLAAWGDLTDALASAEPISIQHRIESVKILRQPGDNEGKHHGQLTAEAVATVEIAHPDRDRVFAMAVTSTDGRDQGRPSAWSSAIDSLAVDALGENEFPKLLVIAGGNTGEVLSDLADYPDYNFVQDIHDPGQAWNALTIGAYTEKIEIRETDASEYSVLAPVGGLSPYSTTSTVWGKGTPVKPDLVLEGGNVGRDAIGCAGMPSLHLLTTHHLPIERLFTTFSATSAATALAGRMAAQIRAEYPKLWPETVRALMVHSAEWTPAMEEQFCRGSTSRQQAQDRLRCVGYGVPNLDRALWSANNSLALIVEDTLQPFEKRAGSSIATRDMHLHDLPWPRTVLQSLGDTEVRLVVTLSYFIEPNPSSRNLASKYSYASHQLRFDVKRPLESVEEFRKRLNRQARDAESGTQTGPTDPDWLIGSQFRNRGSLQKDIWSGKAADLADRAQIVVYPATGWWRTRTRLERYDKKARYALIVSIQAPGVDVDIYSDVLAQVSVSQPV